MADDTAIPAPTDDELEATFDLLQRALSSLPEVAPPSAAEPPASVIEGARWVHDWVNMDAELAQLTHDSLVDRELVAVRSSTSLRHITFSTDSCEIEIEVEPAEQGVSMTGTVSPPMAGTVQAVIGSVSHQGTIDELGTFLIDNVNHGVVMAFIATESGTIRLGSFEV